MTCMYDFPNKILLLQDKETKELQDYWALQDFTDNITKEYVRLDKVKEWLFDKAWLYSESETSPIDVESLVNDLCKEFNKPIYE